MRTTPHARRAGSPGSLPASSAPSTPARAHTPALPCAIAIRSRAAVSSTNADRHRRTAKITLRGDTQVQLQTRQAHDGRLLRRPAAPGLARQPFARGTPSFCRRTDVFKTRAGAELLGARECPVVTHQPVTITAGSVRSSPEPRSLRRPNTTGALPDTSASAVHRRVPRDVRASWRDHLQVEGRAPEYATSFSASLVSVSAFVAVRCASVVSAQHRSTTARATLGVTCPNRATSWVKWPRATCGDHAPTLSDQDPSAGHARHARPRAVNAAAMDPPTQCEHARRFGSSR